MTLASNILDRSKRSIQDPRPSMILSHKVDKQTSFLKPSNFCNMEDLIATSVEAVVIAGRVCERVRTGTLEQQKVVKDDASPVTVADFAAQVSPTRLRHSLQSNSLCAPSWQHAAPGPIEKKGQQALQCMRESWWRRLIQQASFGAKEKIYSWTC